MRLFQNMVPRLGAMAVLSCISGESVHAEAFTTHRIDGIYTNAGPLLVVGESGPFNQLQILNGGWLESGAGVVGLEVSAASNQVILNGSGSRWQATDRLEVGRAGPANQMRLQAGAMLETMRTVVGAQATAASNEIMVEGEGSEWRSDGGFYLGQEGSGQRFILSRGGRLMTDADGIIGHTRRSSGNTFRVEDPGSAWIHGERLWVGAFGSESNRLEIVGGGRVSCVEGGLGNGSWNRAWVAGQGSLWVCRASMFIGNLGAHNQLVLTNGGRAETVSAYLAGDSNEVVVTAGSTWHTGGPKTQLVVGERGSGNRLRISKGSEVSAEAGFVLGDGNEVRISGLPSQLAVRGPMVLGDEFARGNRLLLEDGAQLTADMLDLGGDQGEVTASGLETRLRITRQVSVGGAFGAGNQLRLTGGARLQSGPGYIGGVDSLFDPHDRNQTNAVLLSGAGSAWTIQGDLRVGATGSGSRLEITEDAWLENDHGVLGHFPSSRDNQVLLSGTATLWNNRSNLWVGRDGSDNHLTVTQGATLLSRGGFVGGGNGSDNAIRISGAGAQWINQGDLRVGGSGSNNRLTLETGGWMSSGNAHVGASPSEANPGKTNQVLVTGSDTVWTNRAQVNVGRYNGFNRLVITNHARVDAAALWVGNASSLENRMTILDGGRLELHGNAPVGSARWTVRHATVELDGAEVVVGGLDVAGDTRHPFEFRSGSLRVRQDASVAVGAPFHVGQGSGSARLVLGTAAHAFPDGLVVGDRAEVMLAGAISGTLTNAGRLELGEEVAQLELQGSLHLAAEGETAFDVGGTTPGTSRDHLRVLGPARLGGRLIVRLTGGFIPFSVSEIPLMDHQGATGAFANVASGQRIFVEGTSNSFRLEVTSAQVVLMDFDGPDALPDSDGIDDDWALEYFGHTPLTDEEKSSDSDGDGESAYKEYVAGTDPTEAASVFRILSLDRNEQGRVRLRFPAASDRVYRIGRGPSVGDWQLLSQPALELVSEGIYEWVDPESALPRRFYTVEVALP